MDAKTIGEVVLALGTIIGLIVAINKFIKPVNELNNNLIETNTQLKGFRKEYDEHKLETKAENEKIWKKVDEHTDQIKENDFAIKVQEMAIRVMDENIKHLQKGE